MCTTHRGRSIGQLVRICFKYLSLWVQLMISILSDYSTVNHNTYCYSEDKLLPFSTLTFTYFVLFRYFLGNLVHNLELKILCGKESCDSARIQLSKRRVDSAALLFLATPSSLASVVASEFRERSNMAHLICVAPCASTTGCDLGSNHCPCLVYIL